MDRAKHALLALAFGGVATSATPQRQWRSNLAGDHVIRRLQTSPPACAVTPLVTLSGLSGASAAYGFGVSQWANLSSSFSCGTGVTDASDPYSATYGEEIVASIGPGARQVVYRLDAGFVLSPGWSISIDTCASSPASTLQASLFIGNGCPVGNASRSAWDAFSCDLASPAGSVISPVDGTNICPGGSSTVKQGFSSLTFTVDASSAAQWYYVIVSVPSSVAFTTTGQGVRVNWTIAAPSPSSTPSPSATQTPTARCVKVLDG